MGFLRKALFVGTGGLSGAAGVKANSKKERTAKALEKQNRLLQRQESAAAPVYARPGPISDELAKLAALHDQGALTDEEFDAAKDRLFRSPEAIERPAPEDQRSGFGAALKGGFAQGRADGLERRRAQAQKVAEMKAGGPAAPGYVLTFKGRKRRRAAAQSEEDGTSESN
jgi:hypothetical protein